MTSFLVRLLGGFVDLFDLGEVFAEQLGMEVRTRPAIRVPDVVVVLKQHRDRINQEWLAGAADFVGEVVSKDSTARDRRDKFLDYQAAGVPEYLWVEGRVRHVGFEYYHLGEDRRYQPVQPDAAGRYHSVVLPGLWFDPQWFAREPLPNPLLLLKTIVPDAWHRFAAE